MPDVKIQEALGIDIGSWAPQEGEGPTQVHLFIATSDGGFVVRFKSPVTLDKVIDALVVHRAEVFGPRDRSDPAELLAITERNYAELSEAHSKRLKRVDDLREEKLLVEDQLKSAQAKLETIERINQMVHARTIINDSADLQLCCMALAECSLRRPGFLHAIEALAEKIGGDQGKYFLTEFRKTSADLVKPLAQGELTGKT